MRQQTQNIKEASTDAVVVDQANEKIEKVFVVNMETGKVLKSSKSKNSEECSQKRDEQNNIYSTNIEQPSTRTLRIHKNENGTCGFDITRTKWDPYPWVSRVDENTPAAISGLKVGDCVLNVNGKDVLGLRIAEIAKLVKCKPSHVTLRLWSTGCDAKFGPETLCDAPMPLTLQRLSIIVQSILSIIECPVCLDTISPPAMQCQNGHLLCVECRIRADKCPVCRDYYTPRRALIAEQIYATITNAFNLCRSEDKLRHKLFGTNVKRQQQQQQQEQQQQQQQEQPSEDMSNNVVTTSEDKEFNSSPHPHCVGAEVCKSTKTKSNGVSLPVANKFLTKLLFGKACSMDNLSTTPTTAPTTAVTSSTSLNSEQPPPSSAGCHCRCNLALNVMSAAAADAANNSSTKSNDQRRQSATNQLNCAASATAKTASESNGNHHLAGDALLKNGVLQENNMSNHISLSTHDLVRQQQMH